MFLCVFFLKSVLLTSVQKTHWHCVMVVICSRGNSPRHSLHETRGSTASSQVGRYRAVVIFTATELKHKEEEEKERRGVLRLMEPNASWNKENKTERMLLSIQLLTEEILKVRIYVAHFLCVHLRNKRRVHEELHLLWCNQHDSVLSDCKCIHGLHARRHTNKPAVCRMAATE